MRRLRTFISETEANACAMFLRSHGIAAGVLGQHAANLFPRNRRIGYRIELMLLMDSQWERAQELLAEYDANPIELESAWEEQTEPDLSKLDESITHADCQRCGEPFPLDGSVGHCPGCQAELDIVECIIETHGPEALVDCYPSSHSAFDAAMLDLPCVHCEQTLKGLPPRGKCPRCGKVYDKEAMLRKLGC